MEHHSHPMTRRPLAIARGFYGASLASHDPLAPRYREGLLWSITRIP